jgi:hypothetical protein
MINSGCSGPGCWSFTEAKALPLPGFAFRCIALLAALTACVATVRADIEFVGILLTSRESRFALTDTVTGSSDWVAGGQKFSGFTIGVFDAKADTLVVTRDGAELVLHLKNDAKIKAARLELTGTITFGGGGEKIEVQRATLLYGEENVFPLKDGLTYRITPTRRSDGNINYGISIVRALSETKKETLAAPRVVALPGQPFSVQFGEDLGFSFTPR